MKGAIILDFNRTLYDPDSKNMIDGAKEFLEKYSRTYALAIMGKGGIERSDLIDSLGIRKFFKKVIIKEEKENSDFTCIIDEFGFKPEKIWSIGDRIKKEIKISKSLGMRTIWLMKGKFALEKPESETSFEEIGDIIPSG